MTSAPSTASRASTVRRTRPPRARQASSTAGLGSYPGGVATTTVVPVRAARSSTEWQTLLPSPTQASRVRDRSSPRSHRVKKSAMAWQGCSRSDKPLITGTEAWRASSSTVRWEKTRAVTMSTQLHHADLEGDARPERGLLEDERHGAAGERRASLARLLAGLQLGGEAE